MQIKIDLNNHFLQMIDTAKHVPNIFGRTFVFGITRMFLELVFFQIISLFIFCIFGQDLSDVQIDVYKVSAETKLQNLANTTNL